MKRIISSLLALALLICSLLSFTSCSSEHMLESFKNRLEEEGNYEVDLYVTVPIINKKIDITLSVDGDLMHFSESALTDEIFLEVVDGESYVYIKGLDGEWKRIPAGSTVTDITDTFSILDTDAIGELLNIENYDISLEDELVLTQKEDVTFDFCSDVVMTVSSASCSLEMNMSLDGLTCKAGLEIYNIGKVNLSLPEVE